MLVYELNVFNFRKALYFRNAVCDGDWDKAADEMAASKWAMEDSPARAKRLTDRMRALAAL